MKTQFEHACDLGLSIIHQELNIVPDLTVAQNLYLGWVPRSGPTLAIKDGARRLRRQSAQYEDRSDRLTRATRVARLEIARNLRLKDLVIEPTASLTTTETESFELRARSARRPV